ncbi:ABC transporter permease [Microlunatus sp. Gsoil 973]|uniref:ABC transporter permease n=1 Tax=Microlunatus sp. Gsoil 973 TaxID=2672569 RepID=UPI0012B4DC82|nr:ABC transporter permease [Microlunatus sp. Gsoil 973]QGN34908.1 ABC transporter permease subunit [Microlunatus sp. Gsoil 973]
MGVAKFLGKRLVALVVTIAVVLAVAYLLMYAAPGSFFNSTNIGASLGQLRLQNPELYRQYVQQFESRYGLDQPLWAQTLKYVWHSLTFDFGTSFANPSVPIMHQLRSAFPISAILAIGSIVLSIVIGIPLGVVAALKRNTWLDSTLTTLSVAGQAIPSYVLAVLMVLLFGVAMPGVVPINGWGTAGEAILPIVALSAGNVGVITRYMRGSLIEVLRQEYVRTAEAKGVPRFKVITRHAMRNSLTALITVVGPTFAFTVVSTVWVEQIFSIPGMGNLMGSAFPTKDVPLSITSIYILSLMVMGMNLVVDVLYRAFDPRVALE